MVRLRDDIVLEKVDDVWLLVALRPAWGTCPFAVPTIPVYAEIWQALKTDNDEEVLIEKLMERHGFSRKKAEHVLISFIAAARKNHYLIEEGTAHIETSSKAGTEE